MFIDTGSDAKIQSNRYKIAFKDICGYTTSKSPEHKTMHLYINQGQGNAWNLIWEEYYGFKVGSYRIYRGTSFNNLVLIGSTSGGNTSYSDFNAPTADIYYQIEVIPPFLCSNLKSNNYTSSRSNIVTNSNQTGINTFQNNSYFIIHPNPAIDEFIIETNDVSITQVMLYNFVGQMIKH